MYLVVNGLQDHMRADPVNPIFFFFQSGYSSHGFSLDLDPLHLNKHVILCTFSTSVSPLLLSG